MNILPLNTEPYLQRLREIAAQFQPGIDVETVPEIQAWCNDHGAPEQNPFRSGKALRNRETGRLLILIANPLTPTMISSAVDVMLLRGYISAEEAARLSGPVNFLTHLLLHELAHALDHRRSEEACDRWALSQMEGGVAV